MEVFNVEAISLKISAYLVDSNVEWAVHGPQLIFLILHLHLVEHVLPVKVEVP